MPWCLRWARTQAKRFRLNLKCPKIPAPSATPAPATPTPPRGCSAQEFQCANGQCIRQEFRCNRRYDCSDGSDEQSCRKFNGKTTSCGGLHLSDNRFLNEVCFCCFWKWLYLLDLLYAHRHNFVRCVLQHSMWLVLVRISWHLLIAVRAFSLKNMLVQKLLKFLITDSMLDRFAEWKLLLVITSET